MPDDGVDASKVVVVFKAAGDAPLLKQSKFRVNANEPLHKVVGFLCRQTQRDAVFVYLKAAFTPHLEDSVQSLFDAHGENGSLVIHYSTQPAWG